MFLLFIHSLLFATTAIEYGQISNLFKIPNSTNSPLFSVDTTLRTQYQRYYVKDASSRQAVCNDGTDAVFYFRPATSGSNKKWMIFLQGGSHCSDIYTCALRSYFQTPKMTNLGTTNKEYLQGIFLADSRNFFTNKFNMVYVHYCSSDSYIGDNAFTWNVTDHATVKSKLRNFHNCLAPNVYVDFGMLDYLCKGPQCQLQFRGKKIFNAIMEDLQNSNLNSRFQLNLADTIVFAGSSAGSLGMRQNLDHIKNLFPSKEVLGVSDSGHFEAPTDYIQSQPGARELTTSCTVPSMPGNLSTIDPATSWNAQLDLSCVQKYTSSGQSLAQARQTCLKSSALEQEVSTPYFIQQSYRDNIYLSFFSSYLLQNPAVAQSAAQISHDELLGLSKRMVLGVNDDSHTGLQSSEKFFNAQGPLPQSMGPMNYYFLLKFWIQNHGIHTYKNLKDL